MDVPQVVYIALGLVAAGLAITAWRMGGGTSDTPASALLADQRDRRPSRRARPRLRVEVKPASHTGDYQGGVLHSDATVIAVRLCIHVANNGDRAAGPTDVCVRIPDGIDAHSMQWADPDAVGGTPDRPASEDGAWVLHRRLDGLASGVEEELLLSLNLRPPATGVDHWPLTVTVRTAGPEALASQEHRLAVTRYSNVID